MTIPFGPLRLQITLSRESDHQKGWEEWVAAGMTDHGLARLNQGNRHAPESAYWTGMRWISRLGWAR
jgi:hypothetical protein